LICFIPFSVLLFGSFWLVQRFVQSTVREGLHSSLRESQEAIATIHARGDLQHSRVVKIAEENVSLSADIQLLISSPQSKSVKRILEDRLSQLADQMGFDLMLVSAPDGTPLAGVVRQAIQGAGTRGKLEPLDTELLYHSDASFRVIRGRTLQIASVPISQSDVNIGILSVGEYFDLSDLASPVVLVYDGNVIESNIAQVPVDELARALVHCTDHSECDLRLQGSSWISLPIQSYGGGFTLLSLENVDKTVSSLQSRLNNLFFTLLIVCVLTAFVCTIASSNTIAKPISAVVAQLRGAVRTGVLSELKIPSSTILEIRELGEFYNRAALSVRAAGENLESAYLEFVGSLASALDARDRYTAGHSWRVSQFSCAIATVMELDREEMGRLRIGALLHDIGKIGIADAILQKPGRLTRREQEIVKQHPVIGRRILEGVQGFAPFLAAVELHHENWDGSGYPHGLTGEETPIDARIIHVADAYDAMTTLRSYRRGLAHEEAVAELIAYAGTQFDPRVVEAFVSLPRHALSSQSSQPASIVLAEQTILQAPALDVIEIT
jgi:HD-GYP domain-containing protein (c-di-GMP phosphodiesterase class II)